MDHKKLARLVEQAKTGDADAFAHIYGAFYKSVYYTGLKMTQSEFDARDILQDTMLKVHRNLPNIRNARALVAFVNRTCYNCCIDLLRGKPSSAMGEEEELLKIPEENREFLPEECFEKEELRQDVMRVLGDLAPNHKNVILMHYYQQLPIREIARELDVSEQVVNSRLFRAREAIKRELQKPREAMSAFMSIPVLTKILKADCEALVSPDAIAESWRALAGQLGYAPAVVAATTATAAATAAATTSAFIAAAASAGVAGAAAMKTAAAIVVSGAVLVGGTSLVTGQSPGQLLEKVGKTSERAFHSAVTFLDDLGIPLLSHETPPIPDEEEPIPPTPSDSHITIPSPSTAPPAASENSSPSPSAPEEIPTPSEATSSEQSPPAATETPARPIQTREPYMPAVQPEILSVRQNVLRYPAGEPLSPFEIIRDSGARAKPGARLMVRHLAQVDVNVPNQYGVYLTEVDNQGNMISRVGVILIITE